MHALAPRGIHQPGAFPQPRAQYRMGQIIQRLGHPAGAVWGSGIVLGDAGNLMNNLPAGLIAGQAAAVLPKLAGAVLLGVDIGPNLPSAGRWRRFYGWPRFGAKE